MGSSAHASQRHGSTVPADDARAPEELRHLETARLALGGGAPRVGQAVPRGRRADGRRAMGPQLRARGGRRPRRNRLPLSRVRAGRDPRARGARPDPGGRHHRGRGARRAPSRRRRGSDPAGARGARACWRTECAIGTSPRSSSSRCGPSTITSRRSWASSACRRAARLSSRRAVAACSRRADRRWAVPPMRWPPRDSVYRCLASKQRRQQCRHTRSAVATRGWTPTS